MEDEISLIGSEFEMAMAHLKRQGIMKLSDQLEAKDLSNRILNFALDPFRWDVTLSVPTLGTSNAEGCEPRTEAGSGAADPNPISIGALLNAAEYIAGSTQVQQLPLVRSSSIADQTDSISPGSLLPEETDVFAGDEVYAIANGQPGFRSISEESRGLEIQIDALDPRQKRRRVDSIPLPDENRGSIAEAPENVNQQVEIVSNPELLISVSDYRGTTEKSANLSIPQTHNHQGKEVAMMAEVERLKGTIGGYLFKGIDESRIRSREKEERFMRFTETVRLRLPYHEWAILA